MVDGYTKDLLLRFDGTFDLHDASILHGNSVRRSGMP